MVSDLFKCYLVFNISFVAFRESEMSIGTMINILYRVPKRFTSVREIIDYDSLKENWPKIILLDRISSWDRT